MTGRYSIPGISLGEIGMIFLFSLPYRTYLATKLKAVERPCALLDASCPVELCGCCFIGSQSGLCG